MITVRHTHQDGTIIEGSVKGDGVYELVRRRESGGFTWRPVPGIFIRGSRDKDAQAWRINAAAEALRAAGFEVTVEIDNQWRPTAQREADLAERAEDRAASLRSRAGSAAERGDARWEAARRTLDHIPSGQPMPFDHHSYPADRNRRERAWRNQDRAIDEYRYAERLGARAESVESHQHHRHAPRTIMRRIERLETELRQWQRSPARDQAQRNIDRLTEEIAHWRRVLATRAASGEFIPWTRDDFRNGDEVLAHGRWLPVRRVNAKSVSVPGAFGWSQQGNHASWNDTVPWDKIYGRRRDGWQLDRPDDQPWQVELAERVARWRALLDRAERAQREYTHEAMLFRINVARAQRNVHDLPPDTADDRLRQAQAHVRAEGVGALRQLAAAYLAEYERLASATGRPPSNSTAR